MEKQRNKLFGALIVVAIMAIGFLSTNAKLNNIIRVRDEHNAKVAEALSQITFVAKAISIYDVTDHKKIFGMNDDVPMSIASLAKIMTVLVGLTAHDFDEVVYISPNAVRQAGDFGIFAFEKWKISDIAKFTLVVSANDGAYAIEESSPELLAKINTFAKKSGLANTYFRNVTGLDIEGSVGALASAEEVNTMAVFALQTYPEIFGVTTLPEINLKSESNFWHNFKNTDVLVGQIPNLLFSKTGYTELSGGNLAIIFQDQSGHILAVTVLGSTYKGRFSDMEKIVNILYSK